MRLNAVLPRVGKIMRCSKGMGVKR